MTVTSQPVAAPTSVELEVQRIRGLVREQRFAEAVSASASLRTRYPENRDYITRNSQAAWQGLERFATLERADAQAMFRSACGMAAA